MSNPIEKSLDNMAEISKIIMKGAVERGELTQADIVFLSLYQKEKARATSVPLYKKIIGGIKEISGIIKQFAPEATPPPKSDYLEVDTDVI